MEKLKLVEDNDLWRHAIPDSKPFAVGFGALNLEFDYQKNPQIFDTLLSLKTPEVIESGRTLTVARNLRIEEILKTRFTIHLFDGSPLYHLFGVAAFTHAGFSPRHHHPQSICRHHR